VCECDGEDSLMRRLWATMDCCEAEKVYSKILSKGLKETLIRITKMYKILQSKTTFIV